MLLMTGCAPQVHTKRFADLLDSYPQTSDPLRIRKLPASSAEVIPHRTDPDVYIMVHPAYSLFFRDTNKTDYSEAMFMLLKMQLDREARFMAELSREGKTLVLILPGDYETESVAPLAYTFYLNTTTMAGSSVYYVFSVSANNGTIPAEDMVNLYRFIQGTQPGKVLIGGGYIGRCQKEFYNQLTTYLDRTSAYIIPEISSISPADVSDKEAADIVDSLRQGDYTPIRRFIDKKADIGVNVLSLPKQRKM